MMRVPGRKIARRAMRPLARTLFPGAVVLGYHRVADTAWDPLELAISRERFAAQLAVLRELREIISLVELAARQAAGERLDRYAVLTFDDGYLDFADTVVPMAAESGTPVTVFVASGFTGGDFWWDELVALLAPGSHGAAELELRMSGGEPLRFTGLERSQARAAAACDIGGRLVGCSPHQVEAAVSQLRDWAGDAPTPSGRPMTREELAALAPASGVEIGAHTVSHSCLADLPPESQREEIAASKSELEAICGTPIKVFSYPHGSLSAQTPAVVKSLGFSCACMSRDGMLTARGDPYRIPRLWAPDLDGAEFRQWLGNWVTEAR